MTDSESDDEYFPEENDEDPRSEEEDDYEQRFRKACREAKEIRQVFDETMVDEFFDKYRDVINQRSNKTTANLLHILVNVVTHNEVKPKHIEFLVRRVVENFPTLLTQTNGETYNPIIMAIKASHNELVDYMVTTCISMKGETLHRQSLNRALSMKMNDGKTCLHLAMDKKLSPRIIKSLIQHANDDTLAVQDGEGKTPMHYAMFFNRCTDNGVKLIKLFLERDLQIMRSKHRPSKTFLDATDNDGSSIYWQLHTDTINRQKGNRSKNKSSTDTSKKNQQQITELRAEASPFGENMPQMSSRLSRPLTSAKITDSREKERALAKNDDLKQSTPFTKFAEIRERGTEGRIAAQHRPTMPDRPYADSEQFQVDKIAPEFTPNFPLKRRMTREFETVQEREKEREKERVTSDSTPKKSDQMLVRNKNSGSILHSIKVHYMRTRNTESAIKFLHGDNIHGKMDKIRVNMYEKLLTCGFRYTYKL